MRAITRPSSIRHSLHFSESLVETASSARGITIESGMLEKVTDITRNFKNSSSIINGSLFSQSLHSSVHLASQTASMKGVRMSAAQIPVAGEAPIGGSVGSRGFSAGRDGGFGSENESKTRSKICGENSSQENMLQN